jgi:hypothetical protein
MMTRWTADLITPAHPGYIATSTSAIHQRTEGAGGWPDRGTHSLRWLTPDQASARLSRHAAKPISTTA